MKFHFPSFLLGFGAGAASVTAARGMRPLLGGLATVMTRAIDEVGARMAILQQEVDALVAETRTRARSRSRMASRPPTRRSARPRRARA